MFKETVAAKWRFNIRQQCLALRFLELKGLVHLFVNNERPQVHLCPLP